MRDEMEKIRNKMNPHPAGQKALNVPRVNGEDIPGMQHKYRETALFFPTEAQYCHSYCTYCFRWAQFTAVGSSQQFASKDAFQLRDYLKEGGEPPFYLSELFIFFRLFNYKLIINLISNYFLSSSCFN